MTLATPPVALCWTASHRTVRTFYLPAVGAYLRYLDLPGREPVRVYLPGLGGVAAASFAHVVADPGLAGHRSLLVDFLGFGLSDKPDYFGYTLDDHADTVVALLDQLGLQKCEVIGHSAGGAIAVLVAVRRPDLVAALVVLDGNLDPGGGSFSASIAGQTEAAYIASGYQDQIAALHERARAGEPAAFVGMLQVAAPVAVHRTARSLVDMPPPTVRTHFVRSTLPRSFLVGAHTLEAETSSGAVEDWDFVRGLSDAGGAAACRARRRAHDDAGQPGRIRAYARPGAALLRCPMIRHGLEISYASICRYNAAIRATQLGCPRSVHGRWDRAGHAMAADTQLTSHLVSMARANRRGPASAPRGRRFARKHSLCIGISARSRSTDMGSAGLVQASTSTLPYGGAPRSFRWAVLLRFWTTTLAQAPPTMKDGC